MDDTNDLSLMITSKIIKRSVPDVAAKFKLLKNTEIGCSEEIRSETKKIKVEKTKI